MSWDDRRRTARFSPPPAPRRPADGWDEEWWEAGKRVRVDPWWRRGRVLGGVAAALVILAATVIAIGPAHLFVHANGGNSSTGASGASLPYPANIDFEAGAANAPGKYNLAALNAPGIDGVAVQLNWDAMEPSPGVFNWAPVDQEVADWSTHGKQFILIVRLQGGTSCTGTQTLPAWEIARVPHECAAFPGDVIPDYLDPTYTADSHAYIQAIGQHFAQSPYLSHLAYVRVAKGRGGENMPVKGGPSDPAWAQLVQWGLTPDALKQYQEQRLLFEQSVFPTARVIYNVDPLGVQDPATGQSLQQVVAAFAAAHGMGVGYNGLTPGSSGGIGRSGLLQQYPQTYVTFQTVFSVGSASGIQGDIATAQGAGGRAIEWYTGDATNPANQAAFAQWQTQVDTTFGAVRVGPTPAATPATGANPTATATSPASATPTSTTPATAATATATTTTSMGTPGTTNTAGGGLQPANGVSVTNVPCTVVINGVKRHGTCSGSFVPATPPAGGDGD